MSLTSIYDSQTSAKSSECNPNYQHQLNVIKEREKQYKEFQESFVNIIPELPYELKRKEFNVFELVGYLKIEIMIMAKTEKRLMLEIEAEKADGTK